MQLPFHSCERKTDIALRRTETFVHREIDGEAANRWRAAKRREAPAGDLHAFARPPGETGVF
jgi:hypothetical protein|tara:strand:+ start:302 stop:487 length:186 start_codon:yes stop_codon:yes gene_type:complete